MFGKTDTRFSGTKAGQKPGSALIAPSINIVKAMACISAMKKPGSCCSVTLSGLKKVNPNLMQNPRYPK